MAFQGSEMLLCDSASEITCSAEVDKAKVRSQGGDNPLGAAYNVPVGNRAQSICFQTACSTHS